MTINATDYDVDPLIDDTINDEGVEFPLYGGGKYRGTFKLRYHNQFSTRGKADLRELRKKYRGKIDRMEPIDLMRIALCEINLVDWKDIKAKGKEVPFSVDAALAFFSREDTQWMLFDLNRMANDSANFGTDEDYEASAAQEAEAVEKN